MARLDIKTVNRQRLTDSVTRQLMQAITDQPLRPGDELLSEAELANGFGVSKPVIREALRGLAALGVVEIQQGKLATVRAPTSEPLENFFRFVAHSTREGLREVIELRRVLETEIAALAALRITDDKVCQLEATVAKMGRHLDDVDPWVDTDLGFHILIAESTKNSLMLYLVEALNGLFRESMRLLFLQRELRDEKATHLRHVRIFEALQARDPEAARQAMNVHFDATEPVILAIMKSTDP